MHGLPQFSNTELKKIREDLEGAEVHSAREYMAALNELAISLGYTATSQIGAIYKDVNMRVCQCGERSPVSFDKAKVEAWFTQHCATHPIRDDSRLPPPPIKANWDS